MLPKNKRLKSKKDIDSIFKDGNSVKGSLLLCKYKITDSLTDKPAFSFAKNLKLKAFEKNRLKRQMVHAFKEIIAEFENKGQNNHDMFFILMSIPNETQSRYEQFKTDMTAIITKIKCPKNS